MQGETGAAPEAQEVARLLQELKGRSGLSYGALAKRLHLSGSALHRYCNGEVTPAEFTPLERLARLCGATPQERTDLHRLWIAADTARSDRQPPAPVPAPPAPPTPEPAPPAPAPVPAPAPEPVREPRPATTPAAVPVPLRRRVRHRVPAATTLAALIAATGITVLGVTAGPGSGPFPAPAPAPETGTRSPAPGATGPADPATSAPLTVTVRPASFWTHECDTYAVGRPPSQVPPPPAIVDLPAWISGTGAVPGGYQSVDLVVQGTGDATVVLTALNARITRSQAPPPWNAYSMGNGCGGGVSIHSYSLDLDAARPRPSLEEDRTGLPLKVSAHDPEVIQVTARTASRDVSWYLELEWSSGNRTGTLTIGPGGDTPFRTIAVKGLPLYGYPEGGNAWSPLPTRR
ncbi:helix-turn-helix domain-containing protein [Kitasatospora sp. NPDC088134]|uniref:helix-turn-helix domain-containing protein n=1 Tax=Kitasatospora sp. NPDC088134 TaxID=3364071 RepID=UPI0038278331